MGFAAKGSNRLALAVPEVSEVFFNLLIYARSIGGITALSAALIRPSAANPRRS